MTIRDEAGIQSQIDTLIADNTSNEISEADVRSVLSDLTESVQYFGRPFSYSNTGGSGDRSTLIDVSASSGLVGSGILNFVDGDISANATGSATFAATTVADKYLQFDFRRGARKYFSEIEWNQSGTHSHGVWKIQGSTDLTTWVDLAADFTLGGATQQVTVLNHAGSAYRAIRLLGVSGSASAAPYITEVRFKLAAAPADGLLTYDPLTASGLPASLRAKLLHGYLFNAQIEDVVYDLVSSNDIDLSLPASQSYERTARGIRLTGGVIRVPTVTGCIGQSIIMRSPVGGTGAGFVIEGPNGNGFNARFPDAGATVEKLLAAGRSWRTVRGNPEYNIDRDTWIGYHRERATATTGYAIGGRYGSDGSRVTDMEVAAALFWNAALTTDELTELELWMRRYMRSLGVTMHYQDCKETRDLYVGIGDSMMEGVDLVSNLPSTDLYLPGTDCLMLASASGGDNDAKLAIYNLWGSGHEENPGKTIANCKVSPAFGVVYERMRVARNTGPAVIVNCGEGSSYVTPTSEPSTTASLSWHPDEIRTASGNYVFTIRTLDMVVAKMVEMGVKPSSTIYMMWSLGLNEAATLDRAPSAAAVQGWLQDLLDQLVIDLDPFAVKVLIMRSHVDDPASNATALGYVRTATADFATANANVTMLDNDGNAYIADGVHNTATVLRDQGVAWHALRS